MPCPSIPLPPSRVGWLGGGCIRPADMELPALLLRLSCWPSPVGVLPELGERFTPLLSIACWELEVPEPSGRRVTTRRGEPALWLGELDVFERPSPLPEEGRGETLPFWRNTALVDGETGWMIGKSKIEPSKSICQESSLVLPIATHSCCIDPAGHSVLSSTQEYYACGNSRSPEHDCPHPSSSCASSCCSAKFRAVRPTVCSSSPSAATRIATSYILLS